MYDHLPWVLCNFDFINGLLIMGVDSVFEFLYDFTGVDDELDGRKPVRRLVVVSVDGADVVARFLWIN